METVSSVYDNLPDFGNNNLCDEIEKLEQQNNSLQEYVRSLESDIEKLCARITEMKKIQDNLTKNISELYKTAKAEIERKNRIIAELREQLDNYHMQRKQNNVGVKRERDKSPDSRRPHYDSVNKKMKLHSENSQTRDKTKHYRESKSCSRPNEGYRRPHRDRSRDRKEDKYKNQHEVKKNRENKNGEASYKTSSFHRKDHELRTDKKRSVKEKTAEIKQKAEYDLGMKNDKNGLFKDSNEVVMTAVTFQENNVKCEVMTKTNEPLEKNSETVYQIRKIDFSKNNKNPVKDKNTVDNGTSMIRENNIDLKLHTKKGKIALKSNKTKIDEVTKKLFNRLEGETKQDQVNTTTLAPTKIENTVEEVKQSTHFIESSQITVNGSHDSANIKTSDSLQKLNKHCIIINSSELFSEVEMNVENANTDFDTETVASVGAADQVQMGNGPKQMTETVNVKEKEIEQNNTALKQNVENAEKTQENNVYSKQNLNNKESNKERKSKIYDEVSSKGFTAVDMEMPLACGKQSETQKENSEIIDEPKEQISTETKIIHEVVKKCSEDVNKAEHKCVTDIKPKKTSLKKELNKLEEDNGGLVIEESDRVLRSATRRNSAKGKLQEENKTIPDMKPFETKEKSQIDLRAPVTSELISISLCYETEVHGLHSRNRHSNKSFYSNSGNEKDSVEVNFEKCAPVTTSSPVQSSSSTSFNTSLNISSSMSNSFGESKVFNTSSGNKKRRVVLTMIN